MLTSATALVLSAMAAPAAAGDVTPTSLAVQPPLVALSGAPYDWALQQRGAKGLTVADGTAKCDTVMSYTNGGKDHVPDCGFD